MANLQMFASSSAPATPDSNYKYDIFINHRGPDVKKTLASHLYRRLISYGFRVFLDQQEMQEGEKLSSQIQGAIATASVQVAIFSKRYAESRWCLDELVLMLKSGAPIIPVFYHVQPSELRWLRGNCKGRVYARSLRNLEKKKRYEPNILEEWREALSRVAEISGLELEACNGDEGELVDRILQVVQKKARRPPLDVATYPIGLDENLEDFEATVLLHHHSGETNVVGIVGGGGVGKTTLAKKLFNKRRSDYDRSSFLFDVRETAARSRSSLTSLQSRLFEDLTARDNVMPSIAEGIGMLRYCVSPSTALIILDDVDSVEQLESLFSPVKDVLTSGSLIVITSRNKNVLTNSGIKESSIYKVERLNEEHSQELFCLHAFHQPYPVVGFEELVRGFLHACQGLPLSLKVIGRLLYLKSPVLEYWKVHLDKISKVLPADIHSTLKSSYDMLDQQEREIFLDCACFFIGEDRDKAIRIWNGSGWEGSIGFENLQSKYLVEVDSDNYIRMHPHLRDMGRDLAEHEPMRRLWRPVHVSQQSSVRGIHMAQRSGQSLEGPVELGNRFINFTLSNAVVDMTKRFISSIFGNRFVDIGNRSTRDESLPDLRRLQLLRAEGDCLGSISKGLSNSDLVWLRWDMYPYTSLPVWIPRKKLTVLEVNGAKLETLWQDESEAPIPIQLRELNISSTTLWRVPESTGQLRHLEKMDLSSCSNLQTLPSSLGNLANLQYINLNGCLRLENLPDSFGDLSRLQYLSLAGCSSLTFSSITFGNITTLETLDLSKCWRMEILPLQVTVQRYLKELNLEHTSITELPIAIGNLGNLEILRLQCPSLEMLPLGGLSSLRELTLHFCNKLRQLPESVGELTHLTTLIIHYAPIEYLPAAVMQLNNLEILKVRACPLLEVPFNLRDSSIDKICMIGLRQMDLQGTRLKELSFCKGVCPNLQRLNVSCCHELVVVGALPTSLISLDLQECRALKEIIGLSGLAELEELDISGCDKIEEMPGVDTLGSLNQLRSEGCNMVDGQS